ncbi:hypothetical protein A9Q86_05510 [Flavobacteriales bacterium 33_180_T64]|nr:hypothetical protein A9Q86_05510 [Flavobacteriales bacterium 33_180_T64]
MDIPFREKLNFVKKSIRKNIGPFLIGVLFIMIGCVLMYLGYFTENNPFLFKIGFGFISFGGFFLIYFVSSSYKKNYEQELTKKYGNHTTAIVTNKRIEDYSYTSNTFENGKALHHEEFLYAIEFDFTYNNISYSNHCFFEDKSTFEAITLDTKLPIQFLRNNPNKVTLRRQKLSHELGIPERRCQ